MEIKTKDFNEIMEDMLSRIPDSIDKREGSIIYDALAPAALELNAIYLKIKDVFRLGFVKTSEQDYLTELAFQFGVYRLPATKSIRKAIFNISIAVGTRFSVADSDLNFIVKEKRATDYLLECETAGEQGNLVQGHLIPIDYINGLNATSIGDVIIPGENQETDDALRIRTLNHIQRPEQDGNVSQYLKWASEFVGIGNADVLPLWNGANTVKVIITDSSGTTASPELVANFQNYLDPGISGKGEGKAPIGAFVTVVSATPQSVTVAVKVTLNTGFTLQQATDSINNALAGYVKKATSQKAWKKYEVATLIDNLQEVNYILELYAYTATSNADVIPLDASSIFTLGSVGVTT